MRGGGGRGAGGMTMDLSFLERKTQDRLNRLCRRYIRVAFIYLVLGLLLGVGMLAFGNDNFQFLHVHMLLVGFLLFLIYGIGYKLIPTMFFGLPKGGSIGWEEAQFWLRHPPLVGVGAPSGSAAGGGARAGA